MSEELKATREDPAVSCESLAGRTEVLESRSRIGGAGATSERSQRSRKIGLWELASEPVRQRA